MAMDNAGYHLTFGARIENHTLVMAPQIRAPSGTVLRYEMIAAKTGASGTTSTRQGGEIRINEFSTAALSKFSVNVGPLDRCTVSIKVYEGTTIVAEGMFNYPESASDATGR